MGLVAGDQDRHHVVAFDIVGRADDVSPRTEPEAVKARTLQQHVRLIVCCFAADQAAACWTFGVTADCTGRTGTLAFFQSGGDAAPIIPSGPTSADKCNSLLPGSSSDRGGGAVSSARALEQKRPAGTHMSQSSPSGSGLDRGGSAVSSARALEQKRPAGTRITQSSPSGKRSREPPPPNHPPPARPNRSRRPHPAAPGCIPPRSTATTDAARLARGPTAVWTRARNGGASELLCRHSPVGQLDGVRGLPTQRLQHGKRQARPAPHSPPSGITQGWSWVNTG